MEKNLLLIFVKNPQFGKVKHRIAKLIGPKRTLRVYKELLKHTYTITHQLKVDKAVYYSNFIDSSDLWQNKIYQKYLQEGNDFGEKLLNAFAMGFSKNYQNIVFINNDCFELKTDTINEAYELLKTHKIVVGPTKDGNLYLLGMNVFYQELFMDKNWKSNTILQDTLIDLSNINASFKLLETLTDIDKPKDLIHSTDIKY